MSRPTVTVISAKGESTKDTVTVPNVFKVSLAILLEFLVEWERKFRMRNDSLDIHMRENSRMAIGQSEILCAQRQHGNGKIRC